MLSALKDMEAKLMGHDSSRGEGAASEGISGRLSKEVTFEQTLKQQKEPSSVGIWQKQS